MKKPIKLLTPQSLADKASKAKREDLLKNTVVTGDLAKDCQEELSDTLKAFKARAKGENERMQNATDSEHWFAVSFKTRDQKEAFLSALGWLKAGDKFLDGETIAALHGVELPPSPLKTPRDAVRDRLRSMPSIRQLTGPHELKP